MGEIPFELCVRTGSTGTRKIRYRENEVKKKGKASGRLL